MANIMIDVYSKYESNKEIFSKNVILSCFSIITILLTHKRDEIHSEIKLIFDSPGYLLVLATWYSKQTSIMFWRIISLLILGPSYRAILLPKSRLGLNKQEPRQRRRSRSWNWPIMHVSPFFFVIILYKLFIMWKV